MDTRAGGETPPESYLLERTHSDWARSAGVVFGGLWFGGPVRSVDSTDWPDGKRIVVTYGGTYCTGSPKPTLTIEFTNLAYDTDASNVTYGHTTVTQSIDEAHPGHVYLYDLIGELEPASFKQTDSVSFEADRSVQVTSGMKFDETTTSNTTIGTGDSLPGAKFEEQITLTVGLELTKETAEAKAESTATSHDVEFNVDLEAQRKTLIEAISPQVTSHTPVVGNLVATWAPTFTFNWLCAQSYPTDIGSHNWYYGQAYFWDRGNIDTTACWGTPPDNYQDVAPEAICTLKFASLQDVYDMVTGYNVRYPGMQCTGHSTGSYHGWIDCGGSPQAKAQFYGPFRHPSARTLTIDGVQSRTYESAVSVQVTDVTDRDDDDIINDTGAASCDPASENLRGELT